MFILMGPTAFATPPALRLPLLPLPFTRDSALALTREAVVPPSANATPVDTNLLRDAADAVEDDDDGGTIGSEADGNDGERAVICSLVAGEW